MRKTFALIASLVLVLGLAACGDPNEGLTRIDENSARNNPAPGTSSTATPAGVTLSGEVNAHGDIAAQGDRIDVKVLDDYFEPTFIKVEPGKTYTVALNNEGKRFHTFTIGAQNIDVPLSPGARTETKVTAPQSGSLEFICTPHASMGMRGAFYVG